MHDVAVCTLSWLEQMAGEVQPPHRRHAADVDVLRGTHLPRPLLYAYRSCDLTGGAGLSFWRGCCIDLDGGNMKGLAHIWLGIGQLCPREMYIIGCGSLCYVRQPGYLLSAALKQTKV